MKKRLNGYLTIEASYLLPLILVVYALLLYLGFYLYDACVIVQSSHIAILRASQERNMTDDQLQEKLEKEFHILQKQCLFTKGLKESCSVSLMDITISVERRLETIVRKDLSIKKEQWDMDAEKKRVRIKAESIIRKYERVRMPKKT